MSKTYEAHRNLLTSVATSWGSTTITQFQYNYTPLGQQYTAQESGSAFADYWSGLSYGSNYNYYTYDSYGQLSSSQSFRKTAPSYGTAPTSGDLLPGRNWIYTYDNFGNRKTSGETGTSSDDSYETNNLNQYFQRTNETVRILATANPSATLTVPMTSTVILNTDRSFGGDYSPSNSSGPGAGSLTVSAQTPGDSSPETSAVNWFAPQATQSLSYDADGNLYSDGIWTYTFDCENRLIKMSNGLSLSNWSSSGLTIKFTYDYLNRRVEKIVANSSNTVISDRRYIYDGNNLVAEIDAMSDATTNQILRSYTWGLDLDGSLTATGGVGALIQLTNYTYSGGTLVGTQGYLPSYDGNGNVASLINASSGALAAAYEYSPFGEPLRKDVHDSAIADNAFKFSTKFTDSETGLINYGNRVYSPTLGRFISRDPIGERGGVNLYAFCSNDGINHHDYLGYYNSNTNRLQNILKPRYFPIPLNGRGEYLLIGEQADSNLGVTGSPIIAYPNAPQTSTGDSPSAINAAPTVPWLSSVGETGNQIVSILINSADGNVLLDAILNRETGQWQVDQSPPSNSSIGWLDYLWGISNFNDAKYDSSQSAFSTASENTRAPNSATNAGTSSNGGSTSSFFSGITNTVENLFAKNGVIQLSVSGGLIFGGEFSITWQPGANSLNVTGGVGVGFGLGASLTGGLAGAQSNPNYPGNVDPPQMTFSASGGAGFGAQATGSDSVDGYNSTSGSVTAGLGVGAGASFTFERGYTWHY